VGCAGVGAPGPRGEERGARRRRGLRSPGGTSTAACPSGEKWRPWPSQLFRFGASEWRGAARAGGGGGGCIFSGRVRRGLRVLLHHRQGTRARRAPPPGFDPTVQLPEERVVQSFILCLHRQCYNQLSEGCQGTSENKRCKQNQKT